MRTPIRVRALCAEHAASPRLLCSPLARPDKQEDEYYRARVQLQALPWNVPTPVPIQVLQCNDSGQMVPHPDGIVFHLQLTSVYDPYPSLGVWSPINNRKVLWVRILELLDYGAELTFREFPNQQISALVQVCVYCVVWWCVVCGAVWCGAT